MQEKINDYADGWSAEEFANIKYQNKFDRWSDLISEKGSWLHGWLQMVT